MSASRDSGDPQGAAPRRDGAGVPRPGRRGGHRPKGSAPPDSGAGRPTGAASPGSPKGGPERRRPAKGGAPRGGGKTGAGPPRLRLDKVPFTARMRIVTPITILSGRTLSPGRFIAKPTRTGLQAVSVVDAERFLRESPHPPERKMEIIEAGLAQEMARYVRYTLPCSFRDWPQGREEILEACKDSDGNPVIPASSLKGLLRNAMAFHEAKIRIKEWEEWLRQARREPNRARCARFMDRRLFSRLPGRDFLKGVVVRDPAPGAYRGMRIFEVEVVSLGRQGLRTKESFCCEGWDPNDADEIVFEGYIDRTCLVPDREYSVARWGARILAEPRRIPEILREYSKELVGHELRFYAASGDHDMEEKFRRIVEENTASVLLPFGLGTGWHAKTVGLILGRKHLDILRPRILRRDRDFVVSPGRDGYIFPKTRRIVRHRGERTVPMGWMALEFAVKKRRFQEPVT